MTTTGSGSLYAGVVGTATLTDSQAATVRHWLHKAMRRIADNGVSPLDITPAELRQTAARMITTELEIFTHTPTEYDHLHAVLAVLDTEEGR